MASLDDLRTGSEKRIEDALEALHRRHRELLEAAMADRVSPVLIPNETWSEVERETEEEIVVLLLLAMVAAHDWTAGRIAAQGVETTATRVPIEQYSERAAVESQRIARQTTQTARSKLVLAERNAQQQTTQFPPRRFQPGQAPAEPTKLPADSAAAEVEKAINKALDEIFSKARRQRIAMTETTSAFSTGQIGARDAITEKTQTIVDLVWLNNFDTTKKPDERVCPICRPLHKTAEDVWGQVLPDGPGDSAHPQCRCGLDPRVIVSAAGEAA